VVWCSFFLCFLHNRQSRREYLLASSPMSTEKKKKEFARRHIKCMWWNWKHHNAQK
jgi:hypothetical protein